MASLMFNVMSSHLLELVVVSLVISAVAVNSKCQTKSPASKHVDYFSKIIIPSFQPIPNNCL